jgi:hypothetical protein
VKTFTTTCDRCEKVVAERLSVLTIRHGALGRQFDDPVDLCEACGSSFLSWLKNGRSGPVAGQGEAVAVASGELSGRSA